MIRRLAEHATILFSSHILSEVEALCDRAIILMNGQVKADARLADLEVTADAVLVLAVKTDGVERTLRSLSGVRGIEPSRTPTASRPTASWAWATWISAPPSTPWRAPATGRCASCGAM